MANGRNGDKETAEMNKTDNHGEAPENQTIYSVITSHLTGDGLPEGFTLGDKYETGFIPGGRDGVAIYHVHPLQPDSERAKKIFEALTMISDENNGQYVDRIMEIFEELDRKESIVRLYDEIQQLIYVNQSILDLDALIRFGDFLISYGVSLLAIKVGLTILGVFNIPFVEDVCMEFGYYEEFTYYAARILSNGNWTDGNEKLFKLAKRLHGWGRVYAVACLKPDTQEIKDWLLYEGAKNDVIAQYSADVCLQKADAIGRLGTSITEKEFQAIGCLIEYALESGPCPGLTDPERLLSGFLSAAKDHPFELNKALIQEIRDWTDRMLKNQSLVDAADALMKA